MQHHTPGRSIDLDGTVQGIVIIVRVICAHKVSGGQAGYGAVEDAELENSPGNCWEIKRIYILLLMLLIIGLISLMLLLLLLLLLLLMLLLLLLLLFFLILLFPFSF